MDTTTRRTVRLGAMLTFLVALAAATARFAQGQGTVPPAPTARQPLTLGDAARLAARQNANAEIARQRVREARARITQARSALLPNLSGTASDVRQNVNTAQFGNFPLPGLPPGGVVLPPFTLYDIRGHAALNIVDLSAVGRLRAAGAAERASEADAANTSELAATQAAGAYLQALRTGAQVQARAADSVLAAELLGIARAQLQAGTGVRLDVTRAEAQLAATRAQLIAARNARDRALLDLQRALGLPLETPVVLADSLGAPPGADTLPSEQEATARALRDRPDLRAAEQQVQAARRNISATRAERLPSLAAFGSQGVSGLRTDRLLNTYQVGLQLSLPVFDGFRREGRIQEQAALAREAEIRERDLQQQAATEVRSALLDISSAREQVAAARERLRLAEQEVAQARERFAAGVSGSTDVTQASLGLNAARNLVIDAETAYQAARVSLARATGSVTSIR